MAVQAQRDMREYHIITPSCDLTSVATLHYIPIPASGQVVKATLALTTAITGTDADLQFELAGNVLQAGGADADLTAAVAASAIGRIHTVDFDPVEGANLALEGEQNDLLAAGATLVVKCTDAATAGSGIVIVTIRP